MLSWNGTAGGLVLGATFSAVLLGIITIQLARYFATFPKDNMILKTTLVILWLVECFQLCCVSESLQVYFVQRWQVPRNFALTEATWEAATFVFCTVCASGAVQTFFAYRIYILGNIAWLSIAVQVVVCCQCVAGFIVGVKAEIILSLDAIVVKERWYVVTWLAIHAVADIFIAGLMCTLLWRRRTGFERTDTAIRHLIIFAIESGALTSFLAITILFTFAFYGFHITVLTLGIPAGSFCISTMIANLQARFTIRKRVAGISMPMVIMSPLSRRQKLQSVKGSK
ncbi:hypothetical protein BS47DRAFT_386886 [Hydnum rufescens UP504]|uniref:DUF6534 domain-containing protein n=1 Tax=Hydnum rufescens UP504 TaxID=1448309 RepID=A0A9P6AIW5_9AGAM|nr:hypothetical protein BS47DRAFT_386886 [Hydnum rufescens UP504]